VWHRGIGVLRDQLARNVALVSALMEAGVEFEAVELPLIRILAAVRSQGNIRSHKGPELTRRGIPQWGGRVALQVAV
jgi:hypothetical protein